MTRLVNPDTRPLMTVDMDGVFCEPPLGRNFGIHRSFYDPAEEPHLAKVYPRWVNEPLDRLRFDFRRPMPGARKALLRLATVRRLVVVTGRRTIPTWWLRHHDFDGIFEALYVNRSAVGSAHYKQATLRRLGAVEHVEDDARTAQLLAQTTDIRVYLCDWPRNRDLPLAPAVERVQNLVDLAARLAP